MKQTTGGRFGETPLPLQVLTGKRRKNLGLAEKETWWGWAKGILGKAHLRQELSQRKGGIRPSED
jgi:hypothetical protein